MLNSPTSAVYCTFSYSESTYKKGSIWRPAASTHTQYLRTMFWYARSPILCSTTPAAAMTRESRSSPESQESRKTYPRLPKSLMQMARTARVKWGGAPSCWNHMCWLTCSGIWRMINKNYSMYECQMIVSGQLTKWSEWHISTPVADTGHQVIAEWRTSYPCIWRRKCGRFKRVLCFGFSEETVHFRTWVSTQNLIVLVPTTSPQSLQLEFRLTLYMYSICMIFLWYKFLLTVI